MTMKMPLSIMHNTSGTVSINSLYFIIGDIGGFVF